MLRRTFSLAGMAVLAWLAWLGLLGLMAAMLAARAWHPHFLPLTAILLLLVFAELALIGAGLWRLVRGPRRRHALGWLLIGLVPLLEQSGYFLYGLRAGYSRQLDLNRPLLMLVPFGESVIDLVSRFNYPIRTEGERVVMISAPVADAREQVALMDKHIRAVEARLGKTSTLRIHWLRGPVLGMEGKAIYGLCMGSKVDTTLPPLDGLTFLDRHEVSHCVIAQFADMKTVPPALLIEGWAEANAGMDASALEIRAALSRDSEPPLSLRELTGPKWYGRHEWPVYRQGAPLVNYLLETYGPEKFFLLYSTSKQETFAQDCERILGVTLDQLDAAYWAEIEKGFGGENHARIQLKKLTTGPGIDADAWKTFVNEYLDASARLMAPYQNVTLVAKRTRVPIDPSKSGQEKPDIETYDSRRSGPLRRLQIRHESDVSRAFLAHPSHSFEAQRMSPAEKWIVQDRQSLTIAAKYRRTMRSMDFAEPVGDVAAVLFTLVREVLDQVDQPTMILTRFDHSVENGRRLVSLRIENRAPRIGPYRSASVVLDAEDFYAARSFQFETTDQTTISGRYTYDRHEGVPVLASLETTVRSPKEVGADMTLEVTSCEFGKVPESDFTPETFPGGPVEIKVINDETSLGTPNFTDLYWVPLAAGLVALAIGLTLRPFLPARESVESD